MRPGDANSLTINISGAENATPDSIYIAPLDSVIGRENLLSFSGWKRQGDGWSCSIRFTVFEEGTLTIPRLRVCFKSAGCENTAEKTLVVVPLNVADTVSLRDIKAIHREPPNWTDRWPMFLAIAAVLLAFGLFFWWKSRRNRRPAAQSRIPNPQTPWEWAFEQLDVLEKKSLWQAGGAKQYHTELTVILRGYLSRRFGIAAFKKTSDEILTSLAAVPGFESGMTGELRQLFQTIDLVKFARAEPPNDFHRQALEKTRELVRATVPADGQVIENQLVESEPADFQRRVKVAFHALPNQSAAGFAAEKPVEAYTLHGRRVAAGLVDLLVWLGGSVGVVRLMWWLVVLLEMPDDGKSGTGLIALFLAAGLFGFGYFFHVALEKEGITPGKLAFGLRARAESGRRMSTRQARRRASLKFNPSYWDIKNWHHDPRGQTGYDREAETVVGLR